MESKSRSKNELHQKKNIPLLAHSVNARQLESTSYRVECIREDFVIQWAPRLYAHFFIVIP